MDIQFLQPITFSKILVLRAFAHITVIRICTCVNFEFWVPIQPNHFLDSSIVRSKTKIDVDLLGDLSKPINQSYPLRENVQKSKTSLKQCILTMFLQRTVKCEEKKRIVLNCVGTISCIDHNLVRSWSIFQACLNIIFFIETSSLLV